MSFFLGIDLGGTSIGFCLWSSKGDEESFWSCKTDVLSGSESILQTIFSEIDKVILRLHGQGGFLLGVALGTPGSYSFETGKLRGSPNIPGWDGLSLKKRFSARFANLPLFVGNDANLFAYGEHFLLKKSLCLESCSSVTLTLGTGVGMGIVLNDSLQLGTSYYAGEVGHMIINPGGSLCSCGNRGCFEQYASKQFFERAIRESLDLGLPLDSSVCSGMSVKDLFELWEVDTIATQIIKDFAFYLSVGVVNIIHLFDIPYYIFGGGIASSWDVFYPLMLEYLNSMVLSFSERKLYFGVSQSPIQSGARGAALWGFDCLNNGEYIDAS